MGPEFGHAVLTPSPGDGDLLSISEAWAPTPIQTPLESGNGTQRGQRGSTGMRVSSKLQQPPVYRSAGGNQGRPTWSQTFFRTRQGDAPALQSSVFRPQSPGPRSRWQRSLGGGGGSSPPSLKPGYSMCRLKLWWLLPQPSHHAGVTPQPHSPIPNLDTGLGVPGE